MSTQTEISAEQAAIAAAEVKKADLSKARSAAIGERDDAEVDRIEMELAAADKTIARCRERIGLLEERVKTEVLAERDARLDRLAARAERARLAGQKLITDVYAPAAAQIGKMLRQLWAIERFIDETNRAMASAGRPQVQSPNADRCQPMKQETRIERRRVGIGQPEHPQHAAFRWDANGNARHRETGEYLQSWVEIDVPVTTTQPAIVHEPLTEAVVLPRAGATDPDFWNWAETRRPTKEEQEKLLTDLGIVDEPNKGIADKPRSKLQGKAA